LIFDMHFQTAVTFEYVADFGFVQRAWRLGGEKRKKKKMMKYPW